MVFFFFGGGGELHRATLVFSYDGLRLQLALADSGKVH